jgi:hypothetical protein
MTKALTLTAIVLLVIPLAACSEPQTAAQHVVANGTLAATAQMDQYLRDARATQDARDATIVANAGVMAQTAEASTLEAIARQVTATAIATSAYATARAEEIQAARQATETAIADANATATVQAQIWRDQTATAIANAQMTQAARAHATQTTEAEQHATATAAVVGTQTAILLETQAAEAQRQRIENAAITVLLLVGTCVVLYLIFILARTYNRNAAKAGSVIAYGPHGNPLILADNGRAQTIINPITNTAAITTVDGRGQVLANELPELMRAQAMLGALAVLYQQAQHSPFKPVPGLPEKAERWKIGPVEHHTATGALPSNGHAPTQLASAQRVGIERAPANALPALPPEAPWRLLDDWRGGALPLGLGVGGLLLADPEQYPHWLIAGATGSGKSRFALKPLITMALADGWQVLIFDRNGLHFAPFKAHPNAQIQLLDQPDELAGWFDVLQGEVNRRFKFLAEAGVENWSLAPASKAPRLLAVVDDFSILGDMLGGAERRALWLAARRLAADSRKSGIHLALAVQNPTWQSIDLGLRRNCTPLTFRVNDSDASRVILNAPGAEALGRRQFLMVMGTLERGVVFAPSDEQIAAFLAHRQIPALPRPDWLPVTGQRGAPSAAHEPDQTEQIRALHAAGKSLNAIQTEVFGYRGGAAYASVKAALGDTRG